MAFSICVWPEVLATMFNTSRIGTPERTSEESVRANRAITILWAMEPKIGSLMRMRSQKERPGGVLMYQSQPQMPAPAPTKIRMP